MGKVRSIVLGGVIGAAAGVVLAPRRGETRREALGRLRSAAAPGRGAVRAFAGTPCSAGRVSGHGQGGAPGAGGAAPAATGGGHDG